MKQTILILSNKKYFFRSIGVWPSPAVAGEERRRRRGAVRIGWGAKKSAHAIVSHISKKDFLTGSRDAEVTTGQALPQLPAPPLVSPKCRKYTYLAAELILRRIATLHFDY